ncbi:unnamed protein product [Schistosoma curassoni]|uniref:Uncharacterized protein n=1 Tax=Schistosoma curassoni TaxID=6186 RepID=A0A183KHQ0_9TREM|nr:unnamed protein product [Schistosoma curassoni]
MLGQQLQVAQPVVSLSLYKPPGHVFVHGVNGQSVEDKSSILIVSGIDTESRILVLASLPLNG